MIDLKFLKRTTFLTWPVLINPELTTSLHPTTLIFSQLSLIGIWHITVLLYSHLQNANVAPVRLERTFPGSEPGVTAIRLQGTLIAEQLK
jgi:hypothetical protein